MNHTPGPWHVGHFADDSHLCNCTGILSECYAGAVAEIKIGNGIPIGDGGNDCPPLEEAKANGRLIAAAPDYADAVETMIAYEQIGGDGWCSGWYALKDAHAKATGATS